METIANLEQHIRGFINRPRKQYALLQSRAAWNMLCSCLDLIGDTELALDSYLRHKEAEDFGGKYLLVYGVLQALFLQQDAVKNLCQSLGSKQVIDKNYYFERTIPALVGQMNAERKKVLVPLLVGIKANLDDYPFAQAVTDLHNYYYAGTFTGAIQAIQADAAAKEQRQDEIIATLHPSHQSKWWISKRLPRPSAPWASRI